MKSLSVSSKIGYFYHQIESCIPLTIVKQDFTFFQIDLFGIIRKKAVFDPLKIYLIFHSGYLKESDHIEQIHHGVIE
jgi:hypothetical protein